MLKVVKFGGSSLADAKQMKKAADVVRSDESRRFVIPSAPGKRSADDAKITDLLYECYNLAAKGVDFQQPFAAIKKRFDDIIQELGLTISLDGEFDLIQSFFVGRRGRDYAASRGEYLNGMLLANYLGYEFVDAGDVIFFRDDGTFDEKKTNEALRRRLASVERAVIPGFYGSMPNDTIKTFSRGGSDVTGSIVASAMGADVYENWTDVSGFLVADPRLVESPVGIHTITYKELRELAYMGATVLHEDAIFPVRKSGIPINIRNTNLPGDKGTMIVKSTAKKSRYTITGIACKKGFLAINIEKNRMNGEVGFVRKLLEVLERHEVSFEHIPSGIDTITVIVERETFEGKRKPVIDEIKRILRPDFVGVDEDFAMLAVVGRGMKAARGTAGRIFSALAHANVNVKMIDQGSSELNIIVGVSENDLQAATRAIYDIFVNTELG